ncbi:MAG: hypothetical protein IBX62_01795 [Coriobacteriia bacterium]|nr:hypothetical protein [Coriobacteriia bacterium]
MANAPIMGPMNHITDIDAANDFEKKHTPHIDLQRTEDGKLRVDVKVGYYFPHPNQPDHFIDWLHVYVDHANVAQFDLAAGVAWPNVSVVVEADDGALITAVENCNLHGLWKAEARA